MPLGYIDESKSGARAVKQRAAGGGGGSGGMGMGDDELTFGSRGSSDNEGNAKQGAVRVLVRVRPQLPNDRGSPICIFAQSQGRLLVDGNAAAAANTAAAAAAAAAPSDKGGAAGAAVRRVPITNQSQQTMSFDMTCEGGITQTEFFDQSGIKVMLSAALDGYAATVFAYGQTGSGKTFTMSGVDERLDTKRVSAAISADSGLVPRAFDFLNQEMKAREAAKPGLRFVLRASYMELYNEQLRDLLNSASSDLAIRQRGSGQDGTFFVQGLTVVNCESAADLHAVAAEGHRFRSVASHNLNEDSSRSHSILTIYVECRFEEVPDEEGGGQGAGGGPVQWVRYGKISFIDLAGSENLKTSGITGGEHLKETANINKSLFALGSVISTLGDISTGKKAKTTFIPYRNSKLTMLLADSLGGKALAMMIACVSPIAASIEETRRTLAYASTTRSIQNKPEIAVDPRTKLLWRFREECDRLRAENLALRSLIAQHGVPLPEDLAAVDVSAYVAAASGGAPGSSGGVANGGGGTAGGMGMGMGMGMGSAMGAGAMRAPGSAGLIPSGSFVGLPAGAFGAGAGPMIAPSTAPALGGAGQSPLGAFGPAPGTAAVGLAFGLPVGGVPLLGAASVISAAQVEALMRDNAMLRARIGNLLTAFSRTGGAASAGTSGAAASADTPGGASAGGSQRGSVTGPAGRGGPGAGGLGGSGGDLFDDQTEAGSEGRWASGGGGGGPSAADAINLVMPLPGARGPTHDEDSVLNRKVSGVCPRGSPRFRTPSVSAFPFPFLILRLFPLPRTDGLGQVRAAHGERAAAEGRDAAAGARERAARARAAAAGPGVRAAASPHAGPALAAGARRAPIHRRAPGRGAPFAPPPDRGGCLRPRVPGCQRGHGRVPRCGDGAGAISCWRHGRGGPRGRATQPPERDPLGAVRGGAGSRGRHGPERNAAFVLVCVALAPRRSGLPGGRHAPAPRRARQRPLVGLGHPLRPRARQADVRGGGPRLSTRRRCSCGSALARRRHIKCRGPTGPDPRQLQRVGSVRLGRRRDGRGGPRHVAVVCGCGAGCCPAYATGRRPRRGRRRVRWGRALNLPPQGRARAWTRRPLGERPGSRARAGRRGLRGSIHGRCYWVPSWPALGSCPRPRCRGVVNPPEPLGSLPPPLLSMLPRRASSFWARLCLCPRPLQNPSPLTSLRAPNTRHAHPSVPLLCLPDKLPAICID